MLVVIAVGKSDLLHLHWHFHIHALPTACVFGNYVGMKHYVNSGFDVGIVCCTQDSVTSRCNCRNVKTFETLKQIYPALFMVEAYFYFRNFLIVDLELLRFG